MLNDLLLILKAIADKNRLRIIKMLQKRSYCVCEITAVLDIATSTVSKHLSILKNAGIIEDMKDGKWVHYFLIESSNNIFLNALLPLLSFWLNNDEQIIADLKKLETMNREKLCNP